MKSIVGPVVDYVRLRFTARFAGLLLLALECVFWTPQFPWLSSRRDIQVKTGDRRNSRLDEL